MIKLSIIVPIYNAEKYLGNLMESIVDQITDEIEIILVNDGSTDRSLEICKAYEEKYTNIFVKTIENSGSGMARNHGIEMARGDYLYFPDSDDIMEKSAIKNILEETEKAYDYIVFSYIQAYRDGTGRKEVLMQDKQLDGPTCRKNYNKYLPMSDHYLQGAPWNKVFKRKIVMDNEVRYTSLKRHQDEAFIISYMSFVETIKVSSKPIYTYFLNSSFDESLKFPKNYFDIRKDLFYIFDDHLKSWDSSEKAFVYQAFNFIRALSRIFMLTYSEKWNMNKKERNTYFDQVLNDKLVVEEVGFLKKHMEEVFALLGQPSPIKKAYYKIFTSLVYKKNKTLLKLMAKLMYITKKG